MLMWMSIRSGRCADDLQQRASQDFPEVDSVKLLSDVQGASRREKNRLTFFFCRQFSIGVFVRDEDMPAGHIAASVLLAIAAKFSRLENMSFCP